MSIDWNAVAAASAVVGLLLTGVGSIYAGSQLRISRKIARSEFMFHLYELLQQYNDLHMHLEDGEWPSGHRGPSTMAEWNRIERYMGLFASIQLLIDDGILDLDVVDRMYSHRIVALVRNKLVYQRTLVDSKDSYLDFIRLLQSIEGCRVYRAMFKQAADATTVATANNSPFDTAG